MPEEKISVQVRQEHIDKGSKGDPYKCPVALALSENFPYSIVGYYYSSANFDCYANSEKLRRFMVSFDSGSSVKPGKFFLYNNDLEDRIVEAIRCSNTYTEAAKKFGMSVRTLRRYRKLFNISYVPCKKLPS